MTTERIPFGDGEAILTHHDDLRVGGPPPSSRHDYLGWHAWAETQHKAGLRQKQCGKCGRWFYPQELSDVTMRTTMFKDKAQTKLITIVSPVCRGCSA